MARRYVLNLIATLRHTLERDRQYNRNVVEVYRTATPKRRRRMMYSIQGSGDAINATVEELAQALRDQHRYE